MAATSGRSKNRAYHRPTGHESSYGNSTPTATESYSAFFQRGSISTSSDSNHSSPTNPPFSSPDTPGTSPDTPELPQSYSYPSLSSAMNGPIDGQFDSRAQPQASPRKPRNLKNLALNTSGASQFGRSMASATLPRDNGSNTPLSPSTSSSAAFVRPINTSRRKASGLNLTINTPATETFASTEVVDRLPTALKSARPPGPRQTLSTPSLPLRSAGMAPSGGMRLPTFTSQLARAPSEDDEDESYNNFDAPESRDKQPDAYPNGPICIYDPHVDLYLEPSVEEASNYDVIFNVASEVPNPFAAENKSYVPSISLKMAAKALGSEPQTMTQGDHKIPEYIHVPWEHNTDIVPDLYDLVKVVDDRVQCGKRVLIHCQCGVSRSASLIVAYGIYKNPATTVQQAYDAVKQKSQWIGPNMNLIMQLQEFRTGLIKSELNNRSAYTVQGQTGRKTRGGIPTAEQPSPGSTQIPQTAPLAQTSVKHHPTSINTSNLEHINPGPASAPCDLDLPSEEVAVANVPHSQLPTSRSSKPLESPRKHARPHPTLDLGLSNSSRSSDEAKALALVNAWHTDNEPSFGITSPREERFGLGAQSMFTQPLPTPRSTEFGMIAINPSESADTFTMGLTSPREATLQAQLPQRFASVSKHSSSSTSKHSSSKHASSTSSKNTSSATSKPSSKSATTSGSKHSSSTVPKTSSSSTNKPTSSSKPSQSAHRRPGKLPLSVSTTTASIDEALFSPRTVEFSRNPLADVLTTRPRSEAIIPDALMSPRATEFTENPIHEALAGASRARSSTMPKGVTGAGPSAGRPSDPRSPASRGANPITRDIFDVL